MPVVAVFDIQNEAELEPTDIKQLTNYLEAELTASRKYSVVPTAELRKALQEKKAESLDACYDESCQIEIGKEVAAEKTLATTISRIGESCLVTMQLYDLKRGASEAAATQRGRCGIDAIFASLEKAVAKLTGSRKPKLAIERPKMQADESFGDTRSEWDVQASGNKVVVYFRSQPEGAVVLLNGRLLCQKTPCSKSLPPGRYRVSMQRESYVPSVKEVQISGGKRNELTWSLSPNFGLLEISSSPSRIEVMVNGKRSGRTPLRKLMLPPGRHTVAIDNPCYLRQGKKFSLSAGRSKKIKFDLIPREGAVDVRVNDTEGNVLEAKVYAGGQLLGTSPGMFKVPICTKRLELRAQDYRKKRVNIQVREKQVSAVSVQLVPARGAKRARYLREKRERKAAKKKARLKAKMDKARAARKRAAAKKQAELDALTFTLAIQGVVGTSFCSSSDEVCAGAPAYSDSSETPFGFGGLVYLRFPPRSDDQITIGSGVMVNSGAGKEDFPVVDIPLTFGFRFLSDGYYLEPELGYVFRSFTPESLTSAGMADPSSMSSSSLGNIEGHCFASGLSFSFSDGLELGAGASYYACADPMPSSFLLRSWLGIVLDI